MAKTRFVAGVLMACAVVGVHARAIADETCDYQVLCTNVATLLSKERSLTSPAFTNLMHAYLAGTNVRARALAGLALADSLLTMYDELSDFSAYAEGCLSCSNVLFSSDLPERSWQKSAASLFYAWALRMDGKRELSLAVCRTALSSHLASPTTDVERVVWAAMSREGGLPEMSITNSLKFAAAVSLPTERRPSEWGVYTNGLPELAIQILLE